MKGPMNKHQQLARTGHAEGLCHGGMPKMAKGGMVKHGEQGKINNAKGGTTMKSNESHHAVHVRHGSGKTHHIHVYHHDD